MAGDWIKIEHATPDKPEIVALANHLCIDQDAAFGKCVRLWIWVDQQTLDGNAISVTDSFIDRCTFCPGFAVALRKVGWLNGRESRLSIPNFGKHNGQTAKQRANTNERVAKLRAGCNAPSVTQSVQKPLPELEKRRVNKAAAKAAAFLEIDLAKIDVDAVRITATTIRRTRPKSLAREFVWRACIVAEAANPGLSDTMRERIVAGGVEKPKAYIEKILRDETGLSAAALRAKMEEIAVPEPAKAGASE